MFKYFLNNGVEISADEARKLIVVHIDEEKAIVRYKTQLEKNEEEIKLLKNLLSQSDYYLFKYIEGEMTASEFEPIKSQRALWRKEINQLEDELRRYGAI